LRECSIGDYTNADGTVIAGVDAGSCIYADPLFSSGDPASSTDECNEGGYCISQLPPNAPYRMTATDANDGHSTIVDVPVTTGRTVLDIQLTP
jgi:hypothetical protein